MKDWRKTVHHKAIGASFWVYEYRAVERKVRVYNNNIKRTQTFIVMVYQ